MKFRSLINNVNVINATQAYVDTAVSTKLSITGGTMTGSLTLASTPTLVLEAVTKEYADTTFLNASNPTGTVIEISTVTTPTNYLRANGTQVSKTTYANLFAVIGETYANTMSGITGKPWKQQYSFNTANSTISAWVANTPLPISVSRSHVIVTNNRVYLLGGRLNNTSTSTSTIYTAPINPNGTLGAWAAGAPLPVVISHSQAIVTNNRIYLLGGWNGGTSLNTVYTAPINANGTLGAWVTGAPLPIVIYAAQTIVTNNRVYLLGGRNDVTYLSTVYTAPINANGTLGAWVNSTPLPGAIAYSQAIVTNNRVYLLGGVTNNGVFSSTVYTASINIDGTLSTWTINAPLPVTISHSQAIVTNNRVYLLGGYNNSGDLSAVYTAPINADGTLGAWVINTSILPTTLSATQAIITSSRVYLLGGYDGTISLNTVYSTPFSGGLNNYLNPISINATTFALPDYTIMDTASSPKSYHYIKF